jgi:acetolactate decarboxylase
MAQITVDIPASLKASLDGVAEETRETYSAVVTAALSQHLDVPIHTLFQVSTSGALVAGVYSGVVSVKTILDHGDFGLGTFADLDGEMIVLDGRVYQVQGSGRVSEAPPEALAPFAVVTHLSPQVDAEIETIADFADLERDCDSSARLATFFTPFESTDDLIAFSRAP